MPEHRAPATQEVAPARSLASRRRLLALGAVSTVVLAGELGRIATRGPETAAAPAELDEAAVPAVLVEFSGALFGVQLSQDDRSDLDGRSRYLLEHGGALAADCHALARWVHGRACAAGARSFEGCSIAQRGAIVDELMRIDWRSWPARLLSRLSAHERAHYRMRWSAVPQLAWIYRHAAAAWRARGYRRWPGVPGDWREALRPGDSAYA